MLQIEKIETVSGTRYKVFLNDGTSWQLYVSDLRRYHLTEGGTLTEARKEEIQHTCITVRARKKVLALLEKMDRSEQDIRQRLQRAGYGQEAVEDAIAYAGKFGYIDDERYARNYIKGRSGTKSRRQMEAELRQKGIAGKLSEEMFEEAVPEEEAIRKLICRKTADAESMDPETRQKLAASLYRKGFPSELIRRELHL